MKTFINAYMAEIPDLAACIDKAGLVEEMTDLKGQSTKQLE